MKTLTLLQFLRRLRYSDVYHQLSKFNMEEGEPISDLNKAFSPSDEATKKLLGQLQTLTAQLQREADRADPLQRITAIMGLDKCDCVSLDGKHQCPNKPEHMVRFPDYMQNASKVVHLCTRCYANAEILFAQHRPK